MDTESIHLLAYHDNQLTPYQLPGLDGPGGQCEVRLRKLPGARQVRVVLQAGNATRFRAEVDSDEGMPEVTFAIRRGADSGFAMECLEGAPVKYLQDNPAHKRDYEMPIVWEGPPQHIDLAIVIDATARIFLRDETQPDKLIPSQLLAKQNRTHWEAHVDKLCAFVESVRRSCAHCRIAVLAFGDHAMPENVTAEDLHPAYLLHPKPEQRFLQNVDAAALKSRLLAIPPSSGGDFVDALADALAACDGLFWNPSPGARKLVLISGESPGHSILHPLSKGDVCVREHDVDTQALRLHRKGVALLSLYHGQTDDYLDSLVGTEAKELQEAAKDQYARLATLPQFAMDAGCFEGGAEAELLLGLSGLLGRGGCCGEWVE